MSLHTLGRALVFASFLALACSRAAAGQDAPLTPASGPPEPEESTIATVAKFVAGGALGLAAHEGGHLLFNVAFDANPSLKRVDFHGIPFFAISHRADLPRRKEFVIASAGFWIQHAGSEWILTRRPRIRSERAPIAKGVLAFNVLASGAYAAAAFGRTGPDERDTRGMAVTVRLDERWIGALILAPAVFDAWRYYRPDIAWIKWASRAVKTGMVILIVK
jgi:hypothetical protein